MNKRVLTITKAITQFSFQPSTRSLSFLVYASSEDGEETILSFDIAKANAVSHCEFSMSWRCLDQKDDFCLLCDLMYLLDATTTEEIVGKKLALMTDGDQTFLSNSKEIFWISYPS